MRVFEIDGRGAGALGRCAGGLVGMLLLLSACGDATCPSSSKSVDGQCVPAEVRESGVAGGDDGDAAGAGPAAGRGSDASRSDGGGLKDAGQTASDGGASEDPTDATTAVDAAADAALDPEPGPCADYGCGDHGHCEVVADAPRCACDSGFAGERCESCEPGLGLAGEQCVPACEADGAPDCGAHGSCAVNGTQAECVCEHPAAGTLCDGCAKGFALQDDGSCAADCGDCGAHGFCDGTLHEPVCVCYPGYSRQDQACRWVGDGATGGIRNGDLSNPDGWQAIGVTIQGGAASFTQSGTGANCDLGVLSQTLTMPTRDQAEQFVLEIGTTTACAENDPEACPPLLVELGDAVTRVRVPKSATGGVQRLCLGDAGYGGQVPLRIRPGVARITNAVAFSAAGFSCNTAWPSITGVAIRPAVTDECPMPGVITNGSFDTQTAWVLSSATIQSGALNLSSDGLATIRMIAPTASAVSGAALRIVVRAASDPGAVDVELDGMPLALVRASVTETRNVCLPDWALGAAHEVALRAFAPEMVVDGITVVPESRCGAGVFDRGFERQLETGSWFIQAIGAPDVDIITDSRAIAGDSSLRVRNTVLSTLARFPEASGNAHATISFAARGGNAEMNANIHTLGALPALDATTTINGAMWRVTQLCPGRIWDGQLAQLIASVSAGFVSSGSGTPEALLDEFGAASTALCP
jgi:hypothetical protein